jgi:4-alpha-glucanotransferase
LQRARDSKLWKATADGRRAHAFFQYLFFGQWAQLRAYANTKGVRIIGDAPIFVALDSADVWASPELFEMDTPGQPDFVAGVPPDYFSTTGQLWGNPLYDWSAHQSTGFSWWMERLKANFRLFDVVRLDHFRAFYDYWRIPATAKDARSGSWADGPRHAFFSAVGKQLEQPKLIAEDLGELHDDVFRFREQLGLPGMAILQFAFGGANDNAYLPHNLKENCVVYPGSHDNNTCRGWYEAASEDERDHVRRYFRINGDDIAWDLIRGAYASVANLAVVSMQDLMSLGEEGRMNTPGSEQGNWSWRMTRDGFEQQRHCADYLRQLAWLYRR